MVTAASPRATMTVSMTSMTDLARPPGGSSWVVSAQQSASLGPLEWSRRKRGGACGRGCLLAGADWPWTRDQARLAVASGAATGLVLTRPVMRTAGRIMAEQSTTTTASSVTVDGDVVQIVRSETY